MKNFYFFLKHKLFFLLYFTFLMFFSCKELESSRLKINNNEEIKDNGFKEIIIHKGDDILEKLDIAFDMDTQKIKITTKEDQQPITVSTYEGEHADLLYFELEKDKSFILEVSSKNPLDNTSYAYEFTIEDIKNKDGSHKKDQYKLNRQKRYLGREYGMSDRDREARENMTRFSPMRPRNDAYPSEAVRPYLDPNPPAYVSKTDKLGFYLLKLFNPWGFFGTDLAAALKSKDPKIDTPLAILRSSPFILASPINALGNRLLLPKNNIPEINGSSIILHEPNKIPSISNIIPKLNNSIELNTLRAIKAVEESCINRALNNLNDQEMDQLNRTIREALDTTSEKEKFTKKGKDLIEQFIASIEKTDEPIAGPSGLQSGSSEDSILDNQRSKSMEEKEVKISPSAREKKYEEIDMQATIRLEEQRKIIETKIKSSQIQEASLLSELDLVEDTMEDFKKAQGDEEKMRAKQLQLKAFQRRATEQAAVTEQEVKEAKEAIEEAKKAITAKQESQAEEQVIIAAKKQIKEDDSQIEEVLQSIKKTMKEIEEIIQEADDIIHKIDLQKGG